jgi:hypothetical protein
MARAIWRSGSTATDVQGRGQHLLPARQRKHDARVVGRGPDRRVVLRVLRVLDRRRGRRERRRRDDLIVGAYQDDRGYLFYGPVTADWTGAPRMRIFTPVSSTDYLGETWT